MRFLNRNVNEDNPNFLVGIFLLILLSVFMGPNILPRILSSISPIIDEAIPCDWLRPGLDRGNHQSLIGRASTNALGLEAQTEGLNGSGEYVINIVVINRSLGTVPILYNRNQVNIGDNNTSGLGLVFVPNTVTQNSGRTDQPSFPEENIRLLGPRQRCIHQIRIPPNQVNQLQGMEVKAYYRINSAGSVIAGAATPIYSTQGLNVVTGGYTESAAVPLEIRANSQ